MTLPGFGRVAVWVWREPVDMRKFYDGLAGLARKDRDLLSGDVFLFIGRDRKRATYRADKKLTQFMRSDAELVSYFYDALGHPAPKGVVEIFICGHPRYRTATEFIRGDDDARGRRNSDRPHQITQFFGSTAQAF